MPKIKFVCTCHESNNAAMSAKRRRKIISFSISSKEICIADERRKSGNEKRDFGGELQRFVCVRKSDSSIFASRWRFK